MSFSRAVQRSSVLSGINELTHVRIPKHVAITFPRFFKSLINYCKIRRLSTAEKAAIVTDLINRIYSIAEYLFSKNVREVTVDFLPKSVINALNIDTAYVEDLILKTLYKRNVDFRIIVYDDMSGITVIKIVPSDPDAKLLNIIVNYDYVTELKLALMKFLVDSDIENVSEVTLDCLYDLVNKLKTVLPVKSDPDLLIVFGDYEFPNFIPLNLSYTELVFINKDLPAVSAKDLDYALQEYSRRSRRFGR